MATLPMNRARLNAAVTNQQPSLIAASQANREAHIEAADTIDLLNQKVDGLVGAQVLASYPPSFLSRQAVINGNFDVWQRGVTFANPPSGQFTADRFRLVIVNSGVLPTTINAQKLSINPGDISGAYFGHRINVNGAGSGFGASDQYSLRQEIEFGSRYLCGNGKKVTLSFYAKSDIPGKRIGIALQQKYGSGGSPSNVENLTGQIITLSTSWQKYSVTFTTNTLSGKVFGSNNDDSLQAIFFYMWGSTIASSFFGGGTAETFVGTGNIDIAQVQVNAGDAALPFQPRSFAEELLMCQRYYERSNPTFNEAAMALGYAEAANFINFPVRYKVTKRVAPTVTAYDKAGVANAINNAAAGRTQVTGASAVGFTGVEGGFAVTNSIATVGNHYLCNWTADAEL